MIFRRSLTGGMDVGDKSYLDTDILCALLCVILYSEFMKFLEKNFDLLLDLIVLGLVYFFLLQYFPLEHMMLDTVVTGGDTGSHFKTAQYLKEELLPVGKMIGWYPGNYGGYPLFAMYFPLLFVAAAGLSIFVPLTVSFKFVTVLGPLLLPVCSYLMLRLCRFRFPGPGLAAVASLLFLLNTSNTMWGGNLYSTLAGEFSYAFSFSMMFVLLGMIFRLVEQIEVDHERLNLGLVIGAIFVLILVGTSHGFTLIVASLAIVYPLASPRFFLRKSIVILLVFGIGGLLFAGWFMQLLFNAPYTTEFNVLWTFASIDEVVPEFLIPTLSLYFLFSIYVLVPEKSGWQVLKWRERNQMFFSWYVIFFCVVCFYSSEMLGLPDIRFIPFLHYFTTILGVAFLGTVLGVVCRRGLVRRLLPFIGFCVCILWVLEFSNNSRTWAVWNFKGFENAPGWPVYDSVNKAVSGNYAQPRVAYEHSARTNNLGTVRAFESLPYFSGRATLEGLYFQSSLLSPFVFYVQSLYSKEISCPFPNYPCSRFDLGRAMDYLALFNVDQIILVSEEARAQARKLPNKIELQEKIPDSDYEIWRLQQSETSYVDVLSEAPLYVSPEKFRDRFYSWFRSYEQDARFLYTIPTAFAGVHGIDHLEKRPDNETVAESKTCVVHETIESESILFQTNCVGQPHLVKVAYNPGWKVDGGDGPYLASPAYLLIYPTESEVYLYYDNAGPRQIGLFMAMLGAALLVFLISLSFLSSERRMALLGTYGFWLDNEHWNKGFYSLFIATIFTFFGFVLYGITTPEYQSLFKKYERSYTAKDYDAAQIGFTEITRRWSDHSTLDKVYYFLALSYFLDKELDAAERSFQRVLDYTDSEYLAEAYYHIGIIARAKHQDQKARYYFNFVIDELEDPVWSAHAISSLQEMPSVLRRQDNERLPTQSQDSSQ